MTEFKLDLNTLSCKHIIKSWIKKKIKHLIIAAPEHRINSRGWGEDKAPPLKIYRSISESYLCKFTQVETISLSLFKFNIHALLLLFSAAFSKASARVRSTTKQYLWRQFLFFSRRTFAGARFAERSTDKQSISATFYPEILATCVRWGVQMTFYCCLSHPKINT